MKLLQKTVSFLLIGIVCCSVGASAATLDCDSEGGVLDEIKASRIVVIGEVHGSKEIPEFVGNLLCSLSKNAAPYILALEIPTEEQEKLDSYVNRLETVSFEFAFRDSFFWNRPLHDGRSSLAVAHLIERVRQLIIAGAKLKLLAFDSRDYKTGKTAASFASTLEQVLTKTPDYKMIVLTGTNHAAARPLSKDVAQISDLALKYKMHNLLGFFRGGYTWSCRGMTMEEISCGKTEIASRLTDIKFENSLFLGPIFAPSFSGAYFIDGLSSSPPRFDPREIRQKK